MHRLMGWFFLALLPLLGGCDPAAEFVYKAATGFERALFGFEHKQVKLGELTMHYYEGGDAAQPTVLLLHGFTADKDNWPRFARQLTDRYHVLIPDLAGHGESTFHPEWDYSMPAQAARVQQFLQALQAGPVHIAGNSMGGFLAATFAIRYPDAVRSLALFNAAGVSSPEPSPMDEQVARGENPFFFDHPEQFLRFWQFSMEDPPWIPQFVVEYLGEDYVNRRAEYQSIFADFSGRDLLDDRLDRIQVPTLVLWGAEDRLLDPSMGRVYSEGIPGARLVMMEGVGHLPMVERPSESARIYREFLAGPSKSE